MNSRAGSLRIEVDWLEELLSFAFSKKMSLILYYLHFKFSMGAIVQSSEMLASHEKRESSFCYSFLLHG